MSERDKSDFKSPPGSKTTLVRSGAEQSRGGEVNVEREEKMQFCADIGMSGSGRRRQRETREKGREEQGGRTKVHGMTLIGRRVRVRCQNTMIRSLTRMGRGANRQPKEKRPLSLPCSGVQKGRLALIPAPIALLIKTFWPLLSFLLSSLREKSGEKAHHSLSLLIWFGSRSSSLKNCSRIVRAPFHV